MFFVCHISRPSEQAGQTAAAAAAAPANALASAGQPRRLPAVATHPGSPAALALPEPTHLPRVGEGLTIQNLPPPLPRGW